ncbi:MAG: hypothetical protein OHK0056_06130 [Bacteriovoracaceae bacterium]
MKSLLALATILFSLNSFASETILCTTDGDALDFVEIKDNKLTVGYMSEETETFEVKSFYGTTIIASKPSAYEFGGMISDSVLMNINEDRSFGTLSMGGNVYFLRCNL